MTRTVLIVDDESHIRRGLRVILERIGTTFSDVHECADGREALSYLTSASVDLVIADIRMPRMDGLSLLREIGALPRKPRFVFLTGFDDFRYAKFAVRFGACDFLLKPIDISELKESLLRIERAIDDEESLRRTLTERGSHPLIESSYAMGFIMMNDQLSVEEIRVALEASCFVPVFSESFETFVIRVKDSPACGRSRVEPADWAALLLRNALGQDSEDLAVFVDREGNVVVTGRSGILDDRVLDVFSGSLGGKLPQAGRSGVMCGVEHVRESYVRARQALRYRFVLPHDRPIAFGEIPHDRPAPPVPVDEVQAISSLIGSDMIQEIKQRLTALFDPDRLSQCPMAYTDALVAEVFARVVVVWTRRFPRTEQLKDHAYAILESADSFAGVREYLSHLLSFIIEIDAYVVSLRAAYKDRNIMDSVVLWITENYADRNFSMSLVARRFGFSYTYFSTAFREHAGMSFVPFLKKLRIDGAIRLMADPELRLNAISERVGFANPRLFTRTFQELHGVPPAVYRKSVIGQSDGPTRPHSRRR